MRLYGESEAAFLGHGKTEYAFHGRFFQWTASWPRSASDFNFVLREVTASTVYYISREKEATSSFLCCIM